MDDFNTPNVFELSIAIAAGDSDYTFFVEHRFADWPQRGTVVALKEEAVEFFHDLHPDHEISLTRIALGYLSPDERDIEEGVEVNDR